MSMPICCSLIWIRDLDKHVSIDSFSLARFLTYSSAIFQNDPQGAYASLENDIFQKGTGADGSLFLARCAG